MNDRYVAAMGEVVDGWSRRRSSSGVIVASAQDTFFAGGDLDALSTPRPPTRLP